jgi:hypothetical protein
MAAKSNETPDLIHGDKYEQEAKQVRQLLEHDQSAAAARLQVDGRLAPHELHKFLADLKKECKDLPGVTITDDKKGINVAIKSGDNVQPTDLLKQSKDDLAKAHDAIPLSGQLLGLTDDQVKAVLKIQSDEKAALIAKGQQALVTQGKGFHRFNDIAVSLGYCTPDQAEAALKKQDQLRAEQVAGDLSKGMPILPSEGPYQMLKRTHPEIPDEVASRYAHFVKHLNGGKTVMHVGQELQVLTAKQRKALTTELYNTNRAVTGDVSAKVGQPLSEVPVAS